MNNQNYIKYIYLKIILLCIFKNYFIILSMFIYVVCIMGDTYINNIMK